MNLEELIKKHFPKWWKDLSIGNRGTVLDSAQKIADEYTVELKREIADLERDILHAKENINIQNDELKEKDKTIEEMSATIATADIEIEQKDAEIERLNGVVTYKCQEINTLKDNLLYFEEKYFNLRKQLTAQHTVMGWLRRKINALTSKLGKFK